MNQTYEIKLNGITIPATPYVGTIHNNHTVYNRGEIQKVSLQTIHTYYTGLTPAGQKQIHHDFWKAIGQMSWTLNLDGSLPVDTINNVKMRSFSMTNKLNAIRYMTEIYMNNLRPVISYIDEFTKLDSNEQNILLSHIVGLGEGTYNMITQMPEIVVTLIQKKSYGNFMKYIGLDVQNTILIDLDAIVGAKEAEEQKNEVVDALSEHSEYDEGSGGSGGYEYESDEEEHVQT